MAQSKCAKNLFTYDTWVHAAAGATGSVIAMSAFYPLDTLRSRMQLDYSTKKEKASTLEILKQLVKEEGFGTLYRGLVPVLESLCISNFVYFYTFHGLKSILGKREQQSATKDLLLGAIAGAVNVMLTTPFWVVNTRLKMKGTKADKNESFKNYNNLVEGLIFVAKTEGIKGLWAGAIPSLILVINPALQFMMYESIKRRMIKHYGNLPTLSSFAIGAMAKAFATVLTYPLQLVQTKMRHGDANRNKTNASDTGMLKMILHILKTQGGRGLYRGLEAKILQTVFTAALMFAAYENIVKYVTLILKKR